MAFKDVVKSVWDFIKPKFDTQTRWVPFVGTQFKWSVGTFIRVMTVVLVLFFTILLFQKLDIARRARAVFVNDLWGVKDKGSEVISSPDISYDSDLKSIDDVIKMMENKKKAKKDVKKTK